MDFKVEFCIVVARYDRQRRLNGAGDLTWVLERFYGAAIGDMAIRCPRVGGRMIFVPSLF